MSEISFLKFCPCCILLDEDEVVGFLSKWKLSFLTLDFGVSVFFTSVKKPDGSPSMKKMTELDAGKPVKMTSAKKPDGSPSKKEVLQELNRKLLETSNTILELRKVNHQVCWHWSFLLVSQQLVPSFFSLKVNHQVFWHWSFLLDS
jgi:hypothetical protein